MRFPTQVTDPWLRIERVALWVGLTSLAIGVVLMLCGCQTYEAVAQTPKDTWTNLSKIVTALFADVASVIKWFL